MPIKEEYSKAFPAKHHVFDYVFTDSQRERDFVTTLDNTDYAVYAKLPRIASGEVKYGVVDSYANLMELVQ